MMNVTDRFLRYVKYDTQSDEFTNLTPSTPGQLIFAQALADELKRIGLQEVVVDDNGYVMGTVPATCNRVLPVIGFIAHMDTSPDMSGRNVSPRIVRGYDGGDITLCEEEGIVLSPNDFPEMLDYIGEDIIVTNGKTLLGADDKAGIAEIVTAAEYLISHPEIEHGKIRIAFTPDEEIGKGTDKFNVERFGADWAYTMDGGKRGEIEFENFNAAIAKITFKGRNVHPGYAKHKMINSLRVAIQYAIMLPRWETPEHTEGYEGFYHHLVNKINKEFPDCASLEIKDQYYNMREKIEPVMNIVELAKQAITACGIEPLVEPVRGGTDGARLSFMGLPCPNIFAGGMNFHGRFEYLPIKSMEKAAEVIVEIARLSALPQLAEQ